MLRKFLMAGIACLLLARGNASAEVVPYTVEPHADGRFELIVEKTRLMSGKQHLFLFPEYSGQLRFDAEAPENSSIELRIKTASVVCKDDWVSEKDLVKIEDEARDKMMQADKHPELVFRSKSIRALADGEYEASGDLSIRGAAKPVTVRVTMQPSGDSSLRFEGESTINMRDWGLKPPSAALGTVGTDEMMQVRFRLLARRDG
jgi:polyisoprenoid-binding protein YceI